MKILLSAYACEPGKGSEPEVGWQWATGLALRGHQVWVITRANNRARIEDSTLPKAVQPPRFVYYDLPPLLLWLKRWVGINVYYRWWQVGAARVAARLHAEVGFDRAQHATFVVLRHPSFLRKLDVPFIFGPCAGGEQVPAALLVGTPWRFRVQERTRSAVNRLSTWSPAFRATLRAAERVYVTSQQSAALVPQTYQGRTQTRLAISVPFADAAVARHGRRHPGRTLKCLFVGQLIYLKGIHLLLEALQVAKGEGFRFDLTVVGSGAQGEWLQARATELGVDDQVTWQGQVRRDRLREIYAAHDAFVFPSLRDSGGMVVLEAMAAALPVVCLKLGGPGEIVDVTCGEAVSAEGTKAVVVKSIARALVSLNLDLPRYERLSAGAAARVADFTTDALLQDLGY